MKSSSNKLIINEDFYKLTIENLHEDIFWVDSDAKIINVNPAACVTCGYTKSELMEMSIFQLNAIEGKNTWYERWMELKKNKKIVFETIHRHKTGYEYQVEVNNNYLEFNGKEYSCSIVRDIRKKKLEEELISVISESTVAKVGQDYFKALTQKITEVLDVKTCIITECINTERTKVRTLSFSNNKIVENNIEYDLEGTPCKIVMENMGSELFIPNNCENLYPKEKGYESYVAVPIHSPLSGDVIGHIAALDDRPMQQNKNQTEILKIFASRSGAEIERINAEFKLQKALVELNEKYREINSLKNQLQLENEYLIEEINVNHNFEEIITNSNSFKNILWQVEQVAPTDSTVLILGESGTGKELLARAIHGLSKRANKPLVKVNCAALPASLIESELFGHEKGAFTGATEKKIGRFELADGGTIFLDEIGELPFDLQSKLLRVLQEGEFERLGNSKTQIVNVRVIAATNRHLEVAMEKKEFREDLYYRLNVFPIISIPLRERKSDIPHLVKHFCEKYEKKVGKIIKQIPQKTIDKLMNYHWPGNVRELENVIERSLILCNNTSLEIGDWFLGSTVSNNNKEDDALISLSLFEKKYLEKVLEKTKWKVSGESGAAKILGLNPTTLEAKMKKLGITRSS